MYIAGLFFLINYFHKKTNFFSLNYEFLFFELFFL